MGMVHAAHDTELDRQVAVKVMRPELGDAVADRLVRESRLMAKVSHPFEACAALEPRLRAALRMHLVDELTIDPIGVAYGVHRATAARWIQRAKDELAADTHRRLRAVLALTATELDRVAALVSSQLDVSRSQLL